MASHSIYDTAFEESSLIDLSAFPSIYVKFFNVRAVCVTGPGQRGLAHAKATGAYDPDALSTGLFYDSLWSPLLRIYDLPPDSEVETEAGCTNSQSISSFSVSPGSSGVQYRWKSPALSSTGRSTHESVMSME